MSNECQAVELGPNEVLVNARTIDTHRVQALSRDGGLTFEAPYPVPDLHEPLEGCEGSIVKDPRSGTLFFTNPSAYAFRVNLSLHTSTDNGQSWQPQQCAAGVCPGCFSH